MNAVKALLLLLAAFVCMPATAQTLVGWDDLSRAINQTSSSNIEALNGRRFQVRLENTEAKNLVLSPSEAFAVMPSGNGFTVEIVNARALVRVEDGFTLKVPVGWQAVVGDEQVFPISIEGVDQCIFNLTFRQVGGDILNLSDLKSRLDVNWTFDNGAAIATADVSGAALTLTRAEGNNSDVNVRLRIKNRSGTIDVTSAAIAIPKCGRFLKDSRGEASIVQLRTPGQCVVQTYYKEDGHTLANRRWWEFVETYSNTCDRPVRCNFRWVLDRYNSVEDGVARRNPIFVMDRVANEIFIAASGSANLNTTLETTLISEPYYSYGKGALPDGTLPGYYNPNVVCRWAS